MSKKPIKTRIHKAIFVSVAVGVFVGLTAAALMMYIAWEHNPQLEYHVPGNIHWGHWLFLGFLWFAMVASGISLELSLVSVGIICVPSRSQDLTSEGV